MTYIHVYLSNYIFYTIITVFYTEITEALTFSIRRQFLAFLIPDDYANASYKQRNVIEFMSCRLKDWQRIATLRSQL